VGKLAKFFFLLIVGLGSGTFYLEELTSEMGIFLVYFSKKGV